MTFGSGGSDAQSVAVADVNGDGKLDLIVANECDNRSGCVNIVSVLLGNGDGTFQTAVPHSTGGWGGGNNAAAVAVADVNGDGKPDLLVANLCASYGKCPNGGSVSVLLGNGDGTFQTAVPYSSGGVDATSVAVADVNGDGKLDLLVGNLSLIASDVHGVVAVLLGKGDGTFQTAVTYASGGIYAMSVAVADVNMDGKPDLLVANLGENDSQRFGSVSVLLGNGDGTFQTAVAYRSGGDEATHVAVADVNGDGKLDLIVPNQLACGTCPSSNGSVGVLLGNGDGTFQTAVPYSSGGNDEGMVLGSLAVADLNGDGKPDIVMVNQGNGNEGSVGVLLGNGDGTFQTAAIYGSGGYYATSVAVGDVNGDRKPDIVVSNRCSSSGPACDATVNGSVGVLINMTLSDLVPPTTIATPSPGPNANGWNNTNVTVTLNATDNAGGSGVKQIQFALGGAQNTGWQTVAGNTASVTISAEGTTVLSYFATDSAENQETAKTLTVKIDKTPPVISGLPASGCTIWPANHKLVQVATVTATDALSGLMPGSFKVTGTSNDPVNGQIVISGGPNQFTIQLGADKDEIYTLTATAIDLAANTMTSTSTCTVPHDQGH